MEATIDQLAQAQQADRNDTLVEIAQRKIADCDAKLARYQATLDAGAAPSTVTAWINTVTAERAQAEHELRNASRLNRLTREEIATMVNELSGLSEVIATADPKDKADLYGRMGLRLVYRPEKRIVEARIQPDLHRMCQRFVSEGGLQPFPPRARAG